MDDKQFEQHMKLLKKSYDRVPSKFNADDVLSKIEAEGKPKKEVKSYTTPVASKWQKVSVWAVSLASVLLIGFLSASFINEGKNQGSGANSESKLEDIDQPEEVVINKYGTGLYSQTINWPNSEMQGRAHGFLKSPESDGTYIYTDLSPIEVVVLFEHAKDLGFSEMMYDLVRKYEGMGLIEDLFASGEIPDLIPLGASSLKYNDDLTTEENGELLGKVDVLSEDKVIVSIPVIRNKEGIWQVELDISDFGYKESIISTNESTIKRIQSLYNKFKVKHDYSILQDEGALTVAGIYLEASILGDLETQYELLVKGDNYITPSRAEFLSYPAGGELDWKEQFGTFEFNQVEATEANGEFNGVVWFGLNEEYVTDDESRKGFNMRKTKDGWRVHFMPFQ